MSTTSATAPVWELLQNSVPQPAKHRFFRDRLSILLTQLVLLDQIALLVSRVDPGNE
jgi:hypothetical protein